MVCVIRVLFVKKNNAMYLENSLKIYVNKKHIPSKPIFNHFKYLLKFLNNENVFKI